MKERITPFKRKLRLRQATYSSIKLLSPHFNSSNSYSKTRLQMQGVMAKKSANKFQALKIIYQKASYSMYRTLCPSIS